MVKKGKAYASITWSCIKDSRVEFTSQPTHSLFNRIEYLNGAKYAKVALHQYLNFTSWIDCIVDLKYIFARSQSYSLSSGVKIESESLGISCRAIGTNSPSSRT